VWPTSQVLVTRENLQKAQNMLRGPDKTKNRGSQNSTTTPPLFFLDLLSVFFLIVMPCLGKKIQFIFVIEIFRIYLKTFGFQNLLISDTIINNVHFLLFSIFGCLYMGILKSLCFFICYTSVYASQELASSKSR
jgi:hypothetical protein